MKKLLLIAPNVKNSLMAGGMMFRLPNLGLLRVAALTPPDWEVKIVDEKIEPLDLNQSADFVGITTMTTTVKRGYEIADHFRRRGLKVVMGGMHASCLPQEALQHCDAVVVGEAEKLWPSLLNDLAQNALETRLPARRNSAAARRAAAKQLGIVPPEKIPADSFHGDDARLPD